MWSLQSLTSLSTAGGAKQHPAILSNRLSSVLMAAGRFYIQLKASWWPVWEEVEVS